MNKANIPTVLTQVTMKLSKGNWLGYFLDTEGNQVHDCQYAPTKALLLIYLKLMLKDLKISATIATT